MLRSAARLFGDEGEAELSLAGEEAGYAGGRDDILCSRAASVRGSCFCAAFVTWNDCAGLVLPGGWHLPVRQVILKMAERESESEIERN